MKSRKLLFLLLLVLFLSESVFTQESPKFSEDKLLDVIVQPIGKPNGWYYWGKTERPKFGTTMAIVEKKMGDSRRDEGIGYVTKFEYSKDDGVRWLYEKDTEFIHWVYDEVTASILSLYDSATVTMHLVRTVLAINFDRKKGTVVNSVSNDFHLEETQWTFMDMHAFAKKKANGKNADYRQLIQKYREMLWFRP